ncbi:zona pellucida protein C [Puntigrus tetrazona]|uniref:zona pellucida protein C n=1 Tax=Puntigrus tetrazona TaxID=1606681 RepID=UPI001C8A356A|nr:zona pellucida protein C [Puntigrus tetrazona]
MAAVFVIFCLTIVSLALPVTPNGDGFNGHFSAYSPGIIHDVWRVPDAAAHLQNEVPQRHNFEELLTMFPMPYNIQALLDRRSFSLRIMNSSWTGPADTNVFHRGDQLYLQVSGSPVSGQQLYVQSCHASSSPNHTNKPEVALIINKGCVASKESLVKFVMQQPDRVNLIVRTSSLKSSESYIHCKVYLTNLGVTPTTKSCNYNKMKSSWVDLGGHTSVCDCCRRRCRNLIERVELPISLDLTADVSTGPFILKDQESTAQATPLPLSDLSTKSSPTAKDDADKRWIMAGTSFSGHSVQNVDTASPWPVPPGFGGVMVISQGLGSDLSMWLPDIEFALNPVVQIESGYAGNSDTFQNAEPYRKLQPDVVKSPAVAVGEGKVYIGDVASHKNRLDMWHLNNVDHLHKIQKKPVVTSVDYPEQPLPLLESKFDFAPNDQPLISPTPEKLSESAEEKGEVVFRQAEIIFNDSKGAQLSEPVLYSKLSLNRAADGSSVLSYEEQKRPSMNKRDKRSQLEKSGKDVQMEDTSEIKDLVSSLLDQLRRLWTAQ